MALKSKTGSQFIVQRGVSYPCMILSDVVYHPVIAACFSGRAEKRSSSTLFMTYCLKVSIKSLLKHLHYSSLSNYDFICISQLKKVHEEKTLWHYFSHCVFKLLQHPRETQGQQEGEILVSSQG